jgi:hypothetical protein
VISCVSPRIKRWKEGAREVSGRGGVPVGAGSNRGKKRGRGRKKEAPTHGATMSATAEKEKEMAGRWAE